MSLAYSRQGVITLYRNMLRSAEQMANYNFREHAKRRVKGEFKANIVLSSSEAEMKFAWGLTQMDIMKRQAIISQLYPEESSVAFQRKAT
mmetsp:Transcript_21460/g.35921  ORF Transcript_21460/g.35921 Transcript_21460/m.35921 type:complete len:90 (+) Transcript_21460:146-415(+)|eukprot:CAMPEP_0175025008 /NCGR_PEP_ID=MMETSP0005-20121125/16832_1 /TAXON_ID=420556 /ORGANISM="Ochromonas sp., Strain CCMP1393" /LENGTH=89 /DNA_ID=CAMNT_0016283721 /DNA_START=82 /DNA_END=351 /DNA_ORIENTATION=-